MANFKKYTRYTNVNIQINRKGQSYLPLRYSLNLQPDSTDVSVTITSDLEKRPDLVSIKAYGIPDFWWAIYEYNNIYDPFFNLKAGMVLVIPTMFRLIEAIENLGNI